MTIWNDVKHIQDEQPETQELIDRAEKELRSGTLPPDPMCLIPAQTVRDLIDALK